MQGQAEECFIVESMHQVRWRLIRGRWGAVFRGDYIEQAAWNSPICHQFELSAGATWVARTPSSLSRVGNNTIVIAADGYHSVPE